MPQPWIRRWFARQDNFTLWGIFICWMIITFTIALTIITAIAKLLVLHHL